jgi:hypothetical protein
MNQTGAVKNSNISRLQTDRAAEAGVSNQFRFVMTAELIQELIRKQLREALSPAQ